VPEILEVEKSSSVTDPPNVITEFPKELEVIAASEFATKEPEEDVFEDSNEINEAPVEPEFVAPRVEFLKIDPVKEFPEFPPDDKDDTPKLAADELNEETK
jgi:hypothetical protein